MSEAKKDQLRIPMLSIGLPVYNGSEFVRQAIDALLSQSFTDYELIISDNASTDGTELICREYARRDPRIRYVRQSENRGAINNFQFVLDEAIGEYFMWAAADDIWDATWVETLLPIAFIHQCLAFGMVQTIDEHGKKKDHPANGRKFVFGGARLVRRCRYFISPAFLGKANPIYGIFPTSCLRKTGIQWIESENYGGDVIFLYTVLSRIEMRHGNGVFLYKRIHSENAGADVAAVPGKVNVLGRLTAQLGKALQIPMLGQYVKRSSTIESILLITVYPVCVVLTVLYATALRSQRALKHR